MSEQTTTKCYKCGQPSWNECLCGNYFCKEHGEIDFCGDPYCDDCVEEQERLQEEEDSLEEEWEG